MSHSTPLSDDAAHEARWRERCALRHSAYVSYRYHRRRQRFFDLLDKVTKSITALLGATLFGELFKGHLPVAASLISGLSLLALIFAYGDKKQSHKELSELAMQLAGSIDAQPVHELTNVHLSAWQQELSRLNAKEPPTLSTLVTLCERAQATADGHPDHVPPPHALRSLLADFKS